MASILHSDEETVHDIQPKAIYGKEGPVKLRIATGGAGQTGVLEALADSFISFAIGSGIAAPFRIAWLATDTSLSFNALASRSADIAITYHPYAEQIAVRQGIADRTAYLWRDAFNIVGPASNPAKLPIDDGLSVCELFGMIFEAAVSTSYSEVPVRFLSRYDKSANNILESRIWTTIGQTPWSEPYSTWYHIHPSFPFEALQEATRLSEYTLVDRGTWCTHRDSPIFQPMVCFKEGSILWDETPINLAKGHALNNDWLGNPAHALLSTHAQDKKLANSFLDWMLWQDGGQKVIEGFMVGGVNLHGTSPDRTNELMGHEQS